MSAIRGVLFELVAHAFDRGADPESIVRMYTTLELAEVYSVIGYYLRHKEEVDQWLVELDREAEELRRNIEASQGPARVTREMLRARWAELERQRAAANQ